MNADDAFDALVERHTREPDVDLRKAFASPALRVGERLFAMYVRGDLVVKLPADRCAQLVADGDVDPRPLVTGEVGLDGVDAAFAALADPERHAKILIDPRSPATEPVARTS